MKTYVIIGASSGIGAKTAELLNEEGHHVFGSYKSNELHPTKLLTPFHFDVLDDKLLPLENLPEQIDGILYCPGSIPLKQFERVKKNDLLLDFQLHVTGAFDVIQQLLPRLKKSSAPSIVLFSTVAVQMGFPFHTQISTVKGAVEGLTRSLAADLAPTVRVNAIAPSLTDTPLAQQLLNTESKREMNNNSHPLKRIGTTSDMAEIAHFLLAEKSSWITGQIIHVDGGASVIKK